MVRSARSRLSTVLRRGGLAGLVAAFSMTSFTLLLRVIAGIPLPVELASDRIVPTLSIAEFGRLAASMGGLVRGKEVAFFISLGAQVVFGVAGGLLLPAGALLAGRRKGRAPLAASDHGELPLRTLTRVVGVALTGVWLVALLLLWPVLASNYRGVPPLWATVASSAGLLVSLAAYGAALVATFRLLAPSGPPVGEVRRSGSSAPRGPRVRRRSLLLAGGGLVLATASGSLARSLYRNATFGKFGYDGLQTRAPRVDPITPIDRFYVVTKNLIDPRVARVVWRLEIRGLVDRPRTYGFADLASLPTVTQPTTLECISNPVGGGLISNGLWRGVPLGTLLRAVGPRPGAGLVVAHASDGYVHTLPLEKAMDPNTLLAFEMNGVSLPQRHGYPVRLVVPGAYGEVSVKWLDRIDLVDHEVQGYYERQGWRAQFVKTMSRIDRPPRGQRLSLAQAPMDVGGVAFAGDRGISSVEVSADGGATWAPASFDHRTSPLSWALWSYAWQPSAAGSYQLTVRATDGTGALQTEIERGRAPSGATGYHQVPVEVAG